MAARAATLFLSLVCLPLAALAATFAGVEVPPPPPPRPVVDTHWGVKVEDPYRFLEDSKDAQVQKLMRAQADAAAAIFARIPAREQLLGRIKEIDAATPAVVSTVKRDSRGAVFFLKREAKDNQFKVYWREKAGAPDVLLVDPEAESKATGVPHAVSDLAPSPDGKLLAYTIAAGGGEIGSLRVIDTATRKEVTPAIDRVWFGVSGWLEDGSGFFYVRLAEGYEKRPRAERYLDTHNYLRRLAQPAADVAVFGPGLFPEVDVPRTASGAVFPVPGRNLAAAFVYDGVDPNRSMYLAELDGVVAGKPKWRKVFDKSSQVKNGAIGGGYVYLTTAKDAPRYKLLRLALPEVDMAKAQTLMPAGDYVVDDVAGTREGLYVTRREGVVKKLYRFAHRADAKPQAIGLPLDGAVDLVDAHSAHDGVVLRIAGWTRAGRHYALAADAARPAEMNLVERGKFDAPPGLTAREAYVKSHDGVEVPVSVISRADIKLDGRNPTMLYGYGAYGIVNEPSWTPRSLAWLERGGVVAIAHVRGGGIYGDGWRRAAWKTTKPNTWKDGIAVAEWLIASGYTTRERLSIYGGSAGAIFVGRAITERPDLFSAALIAVGNTDSVRSETRANGAGNVPEYGTVKKEDEFRGLLAMSTYANTKPGTPYPAILFEHGVNDARVDVWMTLKAGARFAAATTSGKPVLMRLEFDSGHGAGTTRDQAQLRLADRWSFFLWQSGVAEFQPKP
jgi:prolyl oligopeptidase